MRRSVPGRMAALLVPTVVALAGCSPFASPSIVGTPPRTSSPAASSGPEGSATAEPAVVPADKRWKPGVQQHGLQIYAHNANGKTADANIEQILDYVIARGANSVSYSFPIYTDGQHPRRVYAGAETPTPAVLAHLATAARERGLRVTLRPLIDEANLQTSAGGWRGSLRPPNLGVWFRSYERAIHPYLDVARSSGAREFVLAAELTSLQSQHARWKALARRAATVFPRTLSYTFNYDSNDTRMLPPRGSAGLDLYFAVDAGPKATVNELTGALVHQIEAKPKLLRDVMVAQEVGIAAEDGAYRHPWVWGSPDVKRVNPTIQVNWFLAACRAVRQTKLDGIYFWMVDSSIDPTQVDPATEGSAGFIGRPAEKAIDRCFSGRA